MKLLPSFPTPATSTRPSDGRPSRMMRRKTHDGSRLPPSSSTGHLAEPPPPVPPMPFPRSASTQEGLSNSEQPFASLSSPKKADRSAERGSMRTSTPPMPARQRRLSLRNLFGSNRHKTAPGMFEDSPPVPALPDLVYSPAPSSSSSDGTSSPAASLASTRLNHLQHPLSGQPSHLPAGRPGKSLGSHADSPSSPLSGLPDTADLSSRSAGRQSSTPHAPVPVLSPLDTRPSGSNAPSAGGSTASSSTTASPEIPTSVSAPKQQKQRRQSVLSRGLSNLVSRTTSTGGKSRKTQQQAKESKEAERAMSGYTMYRRHSSMPAPLPLPGAMSPPVLGSPLMQDFSNGMDRKDAYGSDEEASDGGDTATAEEYGQPTEDGHTLSASKSDLRDGSWHTSKLPELQLALASPADLDMSGVLGGRPSADRRSSSSSASAASASSTVRVSPPSATSSSSSGRPLSSGARACRDMTLQRLRLENRPSENGVNGPGKIYPSSTRPIAIARKEQDRNERTLLATLHRANLLWKLDSRKVTLMEEMELDGFRKFGAPGDNKASGSSKAARETIAAEALSELLSPADQLEAALPAFAPAQATAKTPYIAVKTRAMEAQMAAWSRWIKRSPFAERAVTIVPSFSGETVAVRPIVLSSATTTPPTKLVVSDRARCLAGHHQSIHNHLMSHAPSHDKALPPPPPDAPTDSRTPPPPPSARASMLSTESKHLHESASSVSSQADIREASAAEAGVRSLPRLVTVRDAMTTRPDKGPFSAPAGNKSQLSRLIKGTSAAHDSGGQGRPYPSRHSSLPPAQDHSLAVPPNPAVQQSQLGKPHDSHTRPSREVPPARPSSTMFPNSTSLPNNMSRAALAPQERPASFLRTTSEPLHEGEDDDETPLAVWAQNRQSLVILDGPDKRASVHSDVAQARQSMLLLPTGAAPRQRAHSSNAATSEVAKLQAEIAALRADQARTKNMQREIEYLREQEARRVKDERMKTAIRDEATKKEKEEEDIRRKRDERRRWEEHRRRSGLLETQQKAQQQAAEENRRRSTLLLANGIPAYGSYSREVAGNRSSVLLPVASPPQLYQPQPVYPVAAAVQQQFVHPMFYGSNNTPAGRPSSMVYPAGTYTQQAAMMSASNLPIFAPHAQGGMPYPAAFTPPATPPRYPSPQRESPHRLSSYSQPSNADEDAVARKRGSYLPPSGSAPQMGLKQLVFLEAETHASPDSYVHPDSLLAKHATALAEQPDPRKVLAQSHNKRSTSYDGAHQNQLRTSVGPVRPLPRSASSDPRTAHRGSRAFLDMPKLDQRASYH